MTSICYAKKLAQNSGEDPTEHKAQLHELHAKIGQRSVERDC